MLVDESRSPDPGHDQFQKSKRGWLSLGYLNKIPQTRWLIKNRNLFLTVLETGSPRLGSQHGQVLVKAPFWVADCRHLAVFSLDGGDLLSNLKNQLTSTCITK